MKFMAECPIHSDTDDGAWLDPANIAEFARVAEESGIDGIQFTDHPAPSKKWLERGGHETYEPFVALGFVAAVTHRVRVMTNLTVVPYRNPLLLAKAMTTVDLLSAGRATFVLGTGYLRSEFAALGVDFEERNELFDEAIEVLKGIWSTDELHYGGRHFTAIGQIIKPGPVQRPHPPLWLGGNARVVRDRVARWGQGWAPLQGTPTLARTARTPGIFTVEDLEAMLRDVGTRLEANGRSLSDIDIAAASPGLPRDASAQQRLDAIAHLSELGVTWTGAPVTQGSVPAALDGLRQFGEEIAAKTR